MLKCVILPLPARAAGLVSILMILLLLAGACTAAGDEVNPTTMPEIATPDFDDTPVGPTAVSETPIPPTVEDELDRLVNTEWTLT